MTVVLTESLLDLLLKVDTPTVCKAIEVTQSKRGFTGFKCGTPLPGHQ